MRIALIVVAILAFILIPFFLFEQQLNRFAGQILTRHYPGWILGPVIAGLLASDVFLPIPSSLLNLAANLQLGPAGGFLTNMVGLSAGCWLGYFIGRPGGRLLCDADKARVGKLWRRFGPWTLVIARPIPVLAEASVIFASTAGMSLRRFSIFSTLGNVLVSAFYALVSTGIRQL